MPLLAQTNSVERKVHVYELPVLQGKPNFHRRKTAGKRIKSFPLFTLNQVGALSDRGLLQAAEQVVVLQLEDVLVHVIVHLNPRLLGRQPRLRCALLGHEGRAAGRLGNLDPRQAGLLQHRVR